MGSIAVLSISNPDYYRGNLLLDSLVSHPFFFVPSVGSWIVVYADMNHNPSLILNVYESESLFDNRQRMNILFEEIPIGELIIKSGNSFAIRWRSNDKFNVVNSDELYLEFLRRNLVLSRNYAGKPFNSKASSEYHKWQSSTKFVGGITDIDLLRLDEAGNPKEIIEIKRSRINPKDWKPYSQDKGGYEILDNLCKKLSLDFSIIYYHFDPNKRIEDIQRLTLFRKNEGFNFVKVGSLSLDEFIYKKY